MSANSSVQQMAMALGAAGGGWILTRRTDGSLMHFELVGLISAGSTFLSMWLAGRLRRAACPTVPMPESDLAVASDLLPAPESA